MRKLRLNGDLHKTPPLVKRWQQSTAPQRARIRTIHCTLTPNQIYSDTALISHWSLTGENVFQIKPMMLCFMKAYVITALEMESPYMSTCNMGDGYQGIYMKPKRVQFYFLSSIPFWIQEHVFHWEQRFFSSFFSFHCYILTNILLLYCNIVMKCAWFPVSPISDC